jgi:hypothetical protein
MRATTCAPRPACWKGFPVPRVYTQKKSSRGTERRCGRYGCGKVIEPGERYFQFSFRYGGTHYRCAEHRPRQSELTQSKMSAVYAAIEDAEDNLGEAGTVEEVRGLVEAVTEVVTEVAEEYREAAESFGGAGENAERADELESWASELEDFDPDEPEERPNADEREAIEEKMLQDGFTKDDEAEWIAVLDDRVENWSPDGSEDEDDLLEEAREQAIELLNGCPL